MQEKMKYAENFGFSMLFLRKRQSLSLLELAKRVGLTVQTLSLYEKGQREPTLSVAYEIADVLGSNVADMCKEWWQE